MIKAIDKLSELSSARREKIEARATELVNQVKGEQMTIDTEEQTPEPTIEEHIKRARELTPQQTRVTEPAFEELIRAVEKINELMTAQHTVEFIRGDDEEE